MMPSPQAVYLKARLIQQQAMLNAIGLERMHGQRRLIFITNGNGIWLWDH